MQGSFWKTVALVAVIGVGSLAVLEVQDRLKDSPSVLESAELSGDASLENDLKSVAEKSVDAELEDSEFDKMLKAGFAPSDGLTSTKGGASEADSATSPEGQMAFDLSEPDGSADQTFDTTPEETASQFALADAKSEETDSSVDTRVELASLTDEPNPFDFANGAETNGQADDSTLIQPVGFVAGDQQTGETAAPSAFAAFDPAALGSSKGTPTTGAVSDSSASDSTFETAALPRAVGQMEFFSGDESPASESAANDASAPKTVQASPAAFESDVTEESFGNGSAVGGGFEEFPAAGTDRNSSTGTSNPFPGFSFDDDQPATDSGAPEFSNEPDTRDDRSPFFQPKSPQGDDLGSEFVPLPRDEFGGQEFDPTPDSGSSMGSFDDSSDGTQALPFAEDSDLDVPVLNNRPNDGIDEGLEIPSSEFDRDRLPSDREEATPGFDSGSDFRDFPAMDRQTDETFDSRPPIRTTPDRIPRPRTTPASPWDTDPIDRRGIDRSNIDPGVSRESDFNRRERTFGNENMDRTESRGIDPGFDAAPGRIPVLEDRLPERDNISDRNQPLSIDPGFGTDRTDSNRELDLRDRDFRDRSLSDDPYDRGIGSRPIREFGGSDNSLDFPSRSRSEDGRFEDEPIGSGPLGGVREFGGSSPDRMRDNLRGRTDRLGGDVRHGGNVRQVASVMRPKLILQKSAPENATVGTPLEYSITIRNDGDAPAYDVVVEDEVTAAGRIDGARPQASRTNDGDRLTWEFDSIPPGTEKEIRVQVTPTGEGVIDGVATVKFKSRVKATTTITAPRLQLQMEGPAKVRLGDKVQYLYTIVNEGSGEARSVFVRTVLPQNGGLRHPQGQDLEYEIPLMAPGERREILLSVVAGEPGSQKAQAIVTSRNGSKDEAFWNTDVIGAQLQMLRRGPKRRFVSKTARYENIVTNETDFDAVNARVVEEIPPGMEFKAAGQGGRYDAEKRTVTWAIQRLAAKATTTLQLELEPRVAGQQDSRVMIYENIGAQSDDYVSTTLVEDLHNVSATISQLDGPVALGEGFGFTVTVDNRGTADATDVQLTIQVPREIKVEGAGTQDVQAGLIEESNTVVYRKVVRIRPDQKQDFELKLRGVQPGRNLIVKAEVQSSQMDEPLDVSESVTIYDDRN